MKQLLVSSIVLIGICVTISVHTYSQVKDSLIQLYPGMADTLSYVDKSYFGLFPQIKNFENAVLFIRNNFHFVSKINYSENGILKDTILVNNLSYLDDIRRRIESLLAEYDEKFSSPYDITIHTRGGEKYSGELEAFSKQRIYFQMDENFLTGESENFEVKIPFSNIEEIIIKGKTDYVTPILVGAGIGMGVGLAFPDAFRSEDNGVTNSSKELTEAQKRAGAGIALGILGAGVGWGIAYLNKEKDEVITFKSSQSVLRLKDYARYNFVYDKSFEESHYEVHE